MRTPAVGPGRAKASLARALADEALAVACEAQAAALAASGPPFGVPGARGAAC